VEIRVLGPFEVVHEGRSIAIGGGRQRALLAILALHAKEVVPVGRLIDDLWPDDPPDSALNALQAYVSRLRKALRGEVVNGGGDPILFEHGGYLLDMHTDDVDAYRFARLVAEAERDADRGDAERAAERLSGALALWRGPALPDFSGEPFARTEIARLEELRLQALEARIDADLARGRYASVVAELEALAAEHPHREGFRRQLMLALYGCGRQGDALQVYAETRETLDADLGVEPTPALRELQLAILRHDPALGPPDRRHIASALPRRALWQWLAAGAVATVGAALAIVFLARPSGDPSPVRVVRNSVAVIDARTDAVVDDVVVGDYPGPVAARDGSVWVGNIGASTVTEIDGRTHDAEFPAGVQRPVDIAVTDAALWIANASDFETTPPTGGGTVERRGLRVGELKTAQVGPLRTIDEAGTFVASDGESVWAANAAARTVVRLDDGSGRIVARLDGVDAGGLAVGDGAVWVPEPRRDTVVRLDSRTGRVAARIPVSGHPTRVAVGEGGVWVTTTGALSAVWRIDPERNEAVAVVAVPPKARRIATGGGYVWVTSGRGDEESARRRGVLSKIDPATNTVVATVDLGFRPDGVAVTDRLVWVAIAPV
jgi:DNA-binding SARP family transcriptional activator